MSKLRASDAAAVARIRATAGKIKNLRMQRALDVAALVARGHTQRSVAALCGMVPSRVAQLVAEADRLSR